MSPSTAFFAGKPAASLRPPSTAASAIFRRRRAVPAAPRAPRWVPLAVLALAAGTAAGLQAQAPAAPAPAPATAGTAQAPSRADAYLDFILARHDELLAESEGGSYLDDALEHYNAAMRADPSSTYLPLETAQLLFRSGRSGDAIRMAQSVASAHPDSIAAHETLGEIYLRMAGGSVPGQTTSTAQLAENEYQTLVKLDPTNADYHVVLGGIYRAQDRQDDAEREFRTALSIDAGSEEAAGNLVLLLDDEGKLDAARQVVDNAAAAALSPRLFAVLAQALADDHQYGVAAEYFRKAQAMAPDDTDIQRSLAQTLLDGGDLQGARQTYAALTAADPNDGQNFLRLAQVEQKLAGTEANSAQKLQDFADADRDMQTAVRLNPNDPETGYASALLSQAEGHTDQAMATLQKLIAATAHADNRYTQAESNNRAVLLDELASLQAQSGALAAAAATYQQMEALGGDYTDHALAREVQAYADAHAYDQAAAAAQSALARHPDALSLRLEYANLLAMTGKTDDALTTLQPLFSVPKPTWDAYLARSAVELEGRRYADAGTDAQKAGQLATSDSERARVANQMGSIQEADKQYADAEASFKRALALDADNPEYLNNLGYMLADQGEQLPQALAYLQQAVAHEPDNGAFLDSLGWAYYKLNQIDQATPRLEQAAKLQPGDPAVLDHLAHAYLQGGQLQQAAASWQQALTAWNQQAPAERDPALQAEIEKQLEAVRARIGQQP